MNLNCINILRIFKLILRGKLLSDEDIIVHFSVKWRFSFFCFYPKSYGLRQSKSSAFFSFFKKRNISKTGGGNKIITYYEAVFSQDIGSSEGKGLIKSIWMKRKIIF